MYEIYSGEIVISYKASSTGEQAFRAIVFPFSRFIYETMFHNRI